MVNFPIPCINISQLFRFARMPNRIVEKLGRKPPQKLTQLSLRSNPRHLVGKRTAQKAPS